jgi:hypothetical protein
VAATSSLSVVLFMQVERNASMAPYLLVFVAQYSSLNKAITVPET